MKLFLLNLIAAVLLLATSCESGTSGDGGGDFPGLSTAFDIEISDITASCATVTVTADDDHYFYFDVIDREVLQAFDSPRELARLWIKHILDLVDDYNECDDEGYALSDFLSLHSDTYLYKCELTPETDYAIVAFDVDIEGNIGENISIAEFATGKVEASNNNFNITIDGTLAKIDASIKDEYYLFKIYRSEELESLSEQQIISRLIYDAIDYGVSDFVMGCGNDEVDYNPYLTNGTAFSAVCVGYDGGATTTLTRHDFVYKSDSGDSDSANDYYQGESNLSENVDFRGETLSVFCYGELYGAGVNVYRFLSATASGDALFCVEVCVGTGNDSFEGVFYTTQQIGVESSMIRGYERDNSSIFGSWFVNYITQEQSAAVDGVVTIALNGDNIILAAEWSDANSKLVKASYTGPYTVESVAKKAVCRADDHISKLVPHRAKRVA